MNKRLRTVKYLSLKKRQLRYPTHTDDLQRCEVDVLITKVQSREISWMSIKTPESRIKFLIISYAGRIARAITHAIARDLDGPLDASAASCLIR